MELDNDIVNSMIDEFKENGINFQLIVNVFQELKSIRNMIVRLNAETHFFSSLVAANGESNVFDNKRIITSQQSANDREQRLLLLQAYEKIQQLREYLTGETLSYHLYATTKDGRIYQTTIPQEGKALEDFFILGKREISLRVSQVKKMVEDDKKAEKLQKQWNQIRGWFVHPTAGSYANSLWISQKRQILRRRDANPPPPKKGSTQVFNLGHLIEALDAANAQIPPENNFENLFYQALEYDSVSGFKGGDNGMVQVKANAARLMRYSSIMNALDSICALEHNLTNSTEAMNIIKNLYFSSNTSPEIEQKINDFIEKLGDELLKALKTS